jgi:hypothetical protein
VVSLTTVALLGGGLLAGCGHSAPAAPGVSASVTSAQTTVSAEPSATTGGSTATAEPSATPVKSTVAAAPSVTPVKSTVTAKPSATEPAALSASELLNAMKAAIQSGGSVHNDSTGTFTGSPAVHYTVDATPTGGRQVLTIGQSGQVTILLIDGIGYVQGNAQGLENFSSGLSAQQAKQFAGQWIEIRPGQKLGLASFSDVTGGLSLPSIASSIALGAAPSLVAPTTIGGQPVDGLQGTLPASDGLPAGSTAVLYIAQSTRLPVRLRAQGPGYTDQMTFSRWHEPVDLTVPTPTIPAPEVTSVSSTT